MDNSSGLFETKVWRNLAERVQNPLYDNRSNDVIRTRDSRLIAPVQLNLNRSHWLLTCAACVNLQDENKNYIQ